MNPELIIKVGSVDQWLSLMSTQEAPGATLTFHGNFDLKTYSIPSQRYFGWFLLDTEGLKVSNLAQFLLQEISPYRSSISVLTSRGMGGCPFYNEGRGSMDPHKVGK